MICPKCGFEQRDAAECARCGVIIAKAIRAAAAEETPATRQPASRPSAVSSAANLVARPLAALRETLAARTLPAAGFASVAVSSRMRANLYGQLARMLQSGVVPAGALATVRKAVSNRRMKALCAGMVEQLEANRTLAEVMATYPRDFPAHEIGAVAAGEDLAKLPEVLRRLQARLEAEGERRRTVQGGLVYPGALLILSFFLLPLGYLILGSTAVYLQKALVPLAWTVGIVAGGLFAVPRIASIPRVRAVLRRVAVHIPILSGLRQKQALSTYCEQLSFGVESGLPPARALKGAALAAADPRFERATQTAQAALDAGQPLWEGLQATKLFPDETMMLISSGEETGVLSDNLRDAADAIEEDLGHRARVWTRLLTIALTVGIMGYVGLRVYQGMTDALGSAEEMILKELPGGKLPFKDLNELRDAIEGTEEGLRGPAIQPIPE